jgi:hypothetical protein
LDRKYYASDTIEKASQKVMEIVRFQQQKMFSSVGIANVWNRNSEVYYRNSLIDILNFTGEQGELIGMSVPQARSLVRQMISIITKQKLQFAAKMRSRDYTAFGNGQIAESLANQIVKDQSLDEKIDRLAELTYLHGQCFWHVTWDSEAGRRVDTGMSDAIPEGMPSAPVMSGDVNIQVASAKYVYYDWNEEDWNNLHCVTVAKRMNRWDLIAQHPEMEDELRKIPNFNRILNGFTTTIASFDDTLTRTDDLILVYYYYHKPTPAVPQGRMIIMCSEKCVLYDGANIYECLPVIPCMPEKLDDFLLGYPQFSNLAPLQEMLDINFSTMATNQSAFGVQSVLNPRGSNIDITEIYGMRWIDYTPQGNDGGGKPEPLQLTRSAPEIMDGIKIYIDNLGTLANINSALRGTPPPGVTAGNAIATLTANSIEFFSSFSKSIFASIEQTITLAVKFYKMLGAEEQLTVISDGNISYLKEFKASDLREFERVSLEITNPLMATIAGRRDQAEILLSRGLIKDIGDYFMVLEGEPPKRLWNSELNESALIQKENDDLSKGIPCPVLYTDNHALHIEKHKDILRNPEFRRNGNIQEILNHMEQHEQFISQQQQAMMPQQPMQPGQPEQPLQQNGMPQVEQEPTPEPAAIEDTQQQSKPATPAEPEISF